MSTESHSFLQMLEVSKTPNSLHQDLLINKSISSSQMQGVSIYNQNNFLPPETPIIHAPQLNIIDNTVTLRFSKKLQDSQNYCSNVQPHQQYLQVQRPENQNTENFQSKSAKQQQVMNDLQRMSQNYIDAASGINNTNINTTQNQILNNSQLKESRLSQNAPLDLSFLESQMWPYVPMAPTSNFSNILSLQKLKDTCAMTAEQFNSKLLEIYLKQQILKNNLNYNILGKYFHGQHPQVGQQQSIQKTYLSDLLLKIPALDLAQQLPQAPQPTIKKDNIKWTPKVLVLNTNEDGTTQQDHKTFDQKNEQKLYQSSCHQSSAIVPSAINNLGYAERISSNLSQNYSNEDSTQPHISLHSPCQKSESIRDDSESKKSNKNTTGDCKSLKVKFNLIKEAKQAGINEDLVIKPQRRSTMEIIMCPHKNQKHYAKGMCNHCYHKYGRNSYADACPHLDRLVYAKGKCQNCYLNDYNKQKRKQKKEESPSSNASKNSRNEIEDLELKQLEPSAKRIKISE